MVFLSLCKEYLNLTNIQNTILTPDEEINILIPYMEHLSASSYRYTEIISF